MERLDLVAWGPVWFWASASTGPYMAPECKALGPNNSVARFGQIGWEIWSNLATLPNKSGNGVMLRIST